MNDATALKITIVVCLTAIMISMHLHNINGVITSVIVGIIAAIGGISVRVAANVVKNKQKEK